MSQSTIKINLIWIIAVLIIVNSVILWKLPNGSDLSGYISFAASIASLILAIVAIFYSMISNNDLMKNIGAMSESASTVFESSKQIRDTAENFEASHKRILGEMSHIRPAIDEIARKIADPEITLDLPTQPLAPKSKDTKEADESIPDAPMSLGLSASLYILGKASQSSSKSFTPEDMFPEDDMIWQTVISMCLETLSAFSVNEIKLHREQKSIEVSENKRQVKISFVLDDLGEFNQSKALKLLDGWETKGAEEIKGKIDTYFS